jgi:Zn-dependent protease/CBS domain-containing protein
VREITLLPIGGVASLTKMPDKWHEELLIALAGPLTNIAIVAVFFFPMKAWLGDELFMMSFKAFYAGSLNMASLKANIISLYWINLTLAAFNLLPAFPMDGGRVFRAIMAGWMGFPRATKVAANFGVVFALFFVYYGWISHTYSLIFIGVFIFLSASGEEMQMNVKTALGRYKVSDVLYKDFIALKPDTALSEAQGLMLRIRQEGFPVVDEKGEIIGFAAGKDIMVGSGRYGPGDPISAVMKRDIPYVDEFTPLDQVQMIFSSGDTSSVPVLRGRQVVGVITAGDIGRVFNMAGGGR